MKTILTADSATMGKWVAEQVASDLRAVIEKQGSAVIVVATGASQFDVLSNLVRQPDLDWSKVRGFHLDEYIGISSEHPASFCRYLRERFVRHVDLCDFHFLDGELDPETTIENVGQNLVDAGVDVALVGIGENGHLAFNDPPADFETDEPYIIVELDQPCRQQQVSEGWFGSLAEVPTHAISMSIRQIMKAQKIYCSVPDARKATAVARTMQGKITADVPASILNQHDNTTLVVDEAAASRLSAHVRANLERVG